MTTTTTPNVYFDQFVSLDELYQALMKNPQVLIILHLTTALKGQNVLQYRPQEKAKRIFFCTRKFATERVRVRKEGSTKVAAQKFHKNSSPYNSPISFFPLAWFVTTFCIELLLNLAKLGC